MSYQTHPLLSADHVRGFGRDSWSASERKDYTHRGGNGHEKGNVDDTGAHGWVGFRGSTRWKHSEGSVGRRSMHVGADSHCYLSARRQCSAIVDVSADHANGGVNPMHYSTCGFTGFSIVSTVVEGWIKYEIDEDVHRNSPCSSLYHGVRLAYGRFRQLGASETGLQPVNPLGMQRQKTMLSL